MRLKGVAVWFLLASLLKMSAAITNGVLGKTLGIAEVKTVGIGCLYV